MAARLGPSSGLAVDGYDKRTRVWEVEESPMVEAVARKRLVETEDTIVSVICIKCSCEWCIQVLNKLKFTNPYPVYSHTHTKSWEGLTNYAVEMASGAMTYTHQVS
jgi:hypothetical protein